MSYLSSFHILRGLQFLAEWSVLKVFVCIQSALPHQCLIRLFKTPVFIIDGFEARQSCQGLVSVP